MQPQKRIEFLADVNFHAEGEGVPLVLLHGFCEGSEIFQQIMPAIAAHCHVVCPNLPGHGGSLWDEGLHSIEDAACWLRDFLDALGIERCILVGHSLGGYIAAAFAELFPERLLGLGMLNSTSLGDTEERKESRTKSVAFVQQHGKELFLKAFVSSLFHDPKPEWQAILTRITANTSVEAIIAFLRIMRERADRSSVVGALQVPVMYITGENDGLISPERSKLELRCLPLALLYRIPEASHMGMYEAPEKAIGAILSLVEVSKCF